MSAEPAALQTRAEHAHLSLGEFLQCIIVSFGLFGQQVLILAALGIHVPSRVFTIPGRALMVCLAFATFAALFLRPNRIHLGLPGVAFILFWAGYGARLALDAASRFDTAVEPGRFTIGFIALMAGGACFLPGLAILINSCWAWHRRTRIFAIILAGLSAAAMLKFYGARMMHFEHRGLAGDLVDDVAAVHSLAAGYLGAVLVMFGMHSLSCQETRLFRRITLGIGLGGAGVFLLVGSASRGPVIAVAVASLVLLCSQSKLFDLRRLLMLAILLSSVLAGLVMLVNHTGSSLFDRLFGTAEAIATESESAGRLDLYAIALADVVDSPLVGKSVTIKAADGSDIYPHNLFLESLVATGLLGTAPLLLLIGAGLLAAWRILTRLPELGWIPLLFIVFLTGAMFSGAIYSNSEMWLALAATLSCDAWIRRMPQAEAVAHDYVG